MDKTTKTNGHVTNGYSKSQKEYLPFNEIDLFWEVLVFILFKILS